MSTAYVYTFTDANGDVLYIGCTDNIGRRFEAHRREREWFPEIASMSVDVFPTRAEGAAAEEQRIREQNPRHNRVFTDHTTPVRKPCRKCRSGRHRACLTVNADGDTCPCSLCLLIDVNKQAAA